MSIGQRIAQKRKELALSQEALGEQLGVSRQSIYKWESDSALPEIEKLIALSRLFGVSVGWLLGVEEDIPQPTKEPGSELTEAQLKMVQEIVDRYLAAQPKPPKRKKWPYVLAAMLLFIVGVNLFNRLEQLNNRYDNLQNSISFVTSSVNGQINGISNRVEEILKSQNDLTAEYGTELTAADLARNTVTFSLRAVPKTYTDGMTAVFLTDSGHGPVEFPADLSSGQVFTGEATMELTDTITLSVVFIGADGTRQTQLLDTYEGLFSSSLPRLDIQAMYLMSTDVTNGVLTLNNEYVTIREDTPAKALGSASSPQIAKVKLGVFRNQKLLDWAVPCEQPENFHGDYTGQQFYRLPDITVGNLTSDDKIFIAALVTDSCGRQFMVSDIPFVLDEEGARLTYPSDGRYDSDPDNWKFE